MWPPKENWNFTLQSKPGVVRRRLCPLIKDLRCCLQLTRKKKYSNEEWQCRRHVRMSSLRCGSDWLRACSPGLWLAGLGLPRMQNAGLGLPRRWEVKDIMRYGNRVYKCGLYIKQNVFFLQWKIQMLWFRYMYHMRNFEHPDFQGRMSWGYKDMLVTCNHLFLEAIQLVIVEWKISHSLIFLYQICDNTVGLCPWITTFLLFIFSYLKASLYHKV